VAADTAIDEALPALRRAGVEFTELGLHLPSLDEVFHALTEEKAEVTKESELV